MVDEKLKEQVEKISKSFVGLANDYSYLVLERNNDNMRMAKMEIQITELKDLFNKLLDYIESMET